MITQCHKKQENVLGENKKAKCIIIYYLSERREDLCMSQGRSMAEFEPSQVHSLLNHALQHLGGTAGGSDGDSELGLARRCLLLGQHIEVNHGRPAGVVLSQRMRFKRG